MVLNYKLRSAIYGKWPSATEACRDIGISEPSLSLIVRGRRKPTTSERKKLSKFFSPYRMRQFFRLN